MFSYLVFYLIFSSAISTNVKGFPYKISKASSNEKDVPNTNHIFMRKNNKSNERLLTQPLNSKMHANKVGSRENWEEKPDDIPEATSNPFLEYATVTLTTGTAITTISTTIISSSTVIETSTTILGYNLTEMYTETFTNGPNDTFSLTIQKIDTLVPVTLQFNSSTKTNYLTTTYTIDNMVFLTHTTTETLTSHKSSTRISLPPGQTTYSISASRSTYSVFICYSEISFDEDIETIVYTRTYTSYTWTITRTTPTYTLTIPMLFKKTLVQAHTKVNVTGCKSATPTDTVNLAQVEVTFTDTYTISNIPPATSIPSSSIHSLETLILSITQAQKETDVASFLTVKCKAKTISATWTMVTTYKETSAYNEQTLNRTMTLTNTLQRVVTVIGESGTCYSVSLSKMKTLTDTFETNITKASLYTESLMTTKSIYYSVSESSTFSTLTLITSSALVAGKDYTTYVLSNTLTLVGSNKEEYTFVSTYSLVPIKTTNKYLTTISVYIYTDIGESIVYIPAPEEITINTVTYVYLNENSLTLPTRNSICSNRLEGKTSISSTVIYTYVPYLTLVSYVNNELIDVTLSNLGTTKDISFYSVNALQSFKSINTNTVISSEGSTVIKPSSSCTNSLISTMTYTATYVEGKTEFDVFEDQCDFKKFTYSMTISIFPTVTEKVYDSIITVSLENKDAIQLSVPSLYSVFTYDYTILDSTATYILGNFIRFTISNTFVNPGNAVILSTKNAKYQTATGSKFKSKTFVEYIPIRTAFSAPKIEELNPYYTETELTFTTAKEIKTLSTIIRSKNISYTEKTVTNIFTSTTMFTETFINKDKSYTIGYSAVNVLVPTQISVKSGMVTTTLTYHKISTVYHAVTHTSYVTGTIAKTYVKSEYDPPILSKVLSYNEIQTSMCYHKFLVTEQTSAYLYTNIFSTWQWTSLTSPKTITYTITMLKDYNFTTLTTIAGKTIFAFYASYSCTGTTTLYNSTYIDANISTYTTYSQIEYPPPSQIPSSKTEEYSPVPTSIVTQTYTLSYSTYMTTLSPIMCNEDKNTLTLIDYETFKQTFVKGEKDKYVHSFTQAQTIGFTITKIKANETMCNTHIFKKTVTDTQAFTIVGVDAAKNSMFKESITEVEVPYMKPKLLMTSSTFSYSQIVLKAGESKNIFTYIPQDIKTFVQIGNSMTYVKTYTMNTGDMKLNGPTTAEVLTMLSTSKYEYYIPENSSSIVHSVVYTQKPAYEISDQFVNNNPCISYGSLVVEAPLQTYIETYSEYAFLATFINNGKESIVTKIGELRDVEVTMALFFSTTTVIGTKTAVLLKETEVLPKSEINNLFSTTFILTQLYVNTNTKFTEYIDNCLKYDIVEKETTIKIPTLTNTNARILVSTTTYITTASDVEYATIASEKEYRKGLTLHGKIPTRTFSLYDSYTYTSSFFNGPLANIYGFAVRQIPTVVEVPKKTYTLIIDTPSETPDSPDPISESDLIYIIIGVVAGLIVIAAIIAFVLIWKMRRLNSSDFNESLEESLIERDSSDGGIEGTGHSPLFTSMAYTLDGK